MMTAVSKTGTNDGYKEERTDTAAACPGQGVGRFWTASGRYLRHSGSAFAKDSEETLSTRTRSGRARGHHQGEADGIPARHDRPGPSLDDLLAKNTHALVQANGCRGSDHRGVCD